MADSWGSMWPSVLIGVMPFALWFGLLLWLWSGLACPECGTRSPLLVSPFAKTKRQWAEGGWTCAACGTDVDVRGRKVAPGVGPRPGWLVRSALLVVPPAAVAAVLLYVGVALIRQEPEPPLAPEPPRDGPAAAAPVPPAGRDLQ
jgi:hypothetical protein